MAFKLGTPAKLLEKELKDTASKMQKAGVRALNKTATQGRNVAQREIRQTINLKASRIKQVLKVKRATNADKMSAIRAGYQQVPVIYYNGVRQTKKGVSVRMRKDLPRFLFKGAFIATASGHKGAFRRKKGANRRTKGRPATSSPNLPLIELKGPSPQNIFAEHIDIILKKNDAVLERNYKHELDFIFGRIK